MTTLQLLQKSGQKLTQVIREYIRLTFGNYLMIEVKIIQNTGECQSNVESKMNIYSETIQIL